MRQPEVPASFGRRPLVAVGPRELLEGVLELLVRLNDHRPLLLLGQLVAEYPHWLIVGQRVRTLVGGKIMI